MSKQRNSVVDAARALGITLVVVGHNYIVIRDLKELHDWIYSFHMPLFMMLSGIFFQSMPPSYESIQHRVESLLKPYFAASVISAAVAALRQSTLDTSIAVFGKVLLGSVMAAPDTIEWMPLWFLPHLFVVQLAATAVYATTRNKFAIMAVALTGVTLGQNLFVGKGLPWGLDLTAVTCGYFILGHLIFPKTNPTLSRPNTCAVVSFGVGLTWVTTFLLFKPQVDLHLRIYSGTSAFIVALAGSAFAMCLCAAIQKWRSFAAWAAHVANIRSTSYFSMGGFKKKLLGLSHREWIRSGFPYAQERPAP